MSALSTSALGTVTSVTRQMYKHVSFGVSIPTGCTCRWFFVRTHSRRAGYADVLVCVTCSGDRHISYLPLAHIYERVTLVGVTHGGVSIGFYRCCP